MKNFFFFLPIILIFTACNSNRSSDYVDHNDPSNYISSSRTILSAEEANRLAELPLKCIDNEYPNKPGQTLGSEEDLKEPHVLHPAFYGCFDWHSSVHGHWSLVKLLKMFPDLKDAERIKEILAQNISIENIADEVEYFEGEHNKSYERTYGWAWLLKLADELNTWENPLGSTLARNLQPLTDRIISSYITFLPNLRYPIRVGEHTNTAFGLTFAWDYARNNHIDSLARMIEEKARAFYLDDMHCPIDWEPSGYDFLSPCLEEIDLMRRILDENEFKDWIDGFAPQLASPDFSFEPGEVSDRTDGKLVHLDGLNFSRAWVLYGLSKQYPQYKHLRQIADRHIEYSLPWLTDGNYEGEHWLASFAIYALANVN
jgi:hypothetical protein